MADGAEEGEVLEDVPAGAKRMRAWESEPPPRDSSAPDDYGEWPPPPRRAFERHRPDVRDSLFAERRPYPDARQPADHDTRGLACRVAVNTLEAACSSVLRGEMALMAEGSVKPLACMA